MYASDKSAIAMKPRHAHIFTRDLNDRYVEPLWCSARLFEVEQFDGAVHDPAAGTEQILTAAAAAGLDATGADIAPCVPDGAELDFLATSTKVANIASNPPYHYAREFALHPLSLTENKVALLLPVARLNAAGSWLRNTPIRKVWLLTPRPSVSPHSYLLAGRKPQGGRVDYAWWIWERGYRGQPQLRWLRRETGRKVT